MTAPTLALTPLAGVPEVHEGDDLGVLLAAALDDAGIALADGDLLVVSSKVISKAAGLRALAGNKAAVVLAQSRRVVAERMGIGGVTRIVESLAGPVLAAAGVDESNTGAEGTLLLLPPDPDAAAAELVAGVAARYALGHGDCPRIGLLISDTAGRPWREGQVDFALGAAGIRVSIDHRGEPDDDGRLLQVTTRAVADEIAGAADLVKGKVGRVAAVHVRGLGELVTGTAGLNGPGQGAGSLVRTGPGDWFALGHLEAVRAALGVPPGSPQAADVGIPPVAADQDDAEQRIRRACAVAVHPEALGRLPDHHQRGHLVRHHTNLGSARTQLIQYGVRLEAPDPFTLGLVVARLLAALESEGIPGRLAQRDDTPAPSGRERATALVLFA